MITLRTLTAVGLVLALSSAAHAGKKDSSGKKHAPPRVHSASGMAAHPKVAPKTGAPAVRQGNRTHRVVPNSRPSAIIPAGSNQAYGSKYGPPKPLSEIFHGWDKETGKPVTVDVFKEPAPKQP